MGADIYRDRDMLRKQRLTRCGGTARVKEASVLRARENRARPTGWVEMTGFPVGLDDPL
jgi:hypothetical protein